MGERPSEYARDADDWYVEPSWCVDALLQHVAIPFGVAHDPCCGSGTIPSALTAAGFTASGADIVDRANGRYDVLDFLADKATRPNIITNPPFKIADQIVRHALAHVQHGGIVAIIAQAKFLFSQARYPLFADPKPERVLIFSRRPSMPPGAMLLEHGEACRGGGSIDFVWVVWRVGHAPAQTVIEWVSP